MKAKEILALLTLVLFSCAVAAVAAARPLTRPGQSSRPDALGQSATRKLKIKSKTGCRLHRGGQKEQDPRASGIAR